MQKLRRQAGRWEACKNCRAAAAPGCAAALPNASRTPYDRNCGKGRPLPNPQRPKYRRSSVPKVQSPSEAAYSVAYHCRSRPPHRMRQTKQEWQWQLIFSYFKPFSAEKPLFRLYGYFRNISPAVHFFNIYFPRSGQKTTKNITGGLFPERPRSLRAFRASPWKSVGTMPIMSVGHLGVRRFISAFQSHVSFIFGFALQQEQARCPEDNNF